MFYFMLVVYLLALWLKSQIELEPLKMLWMLQPSEMNEFYLWIMAIAMFVYSLQFLVSFYRAQQLVLNSKEIIC